MQAAEHLNHLVEVTQTHVARFRVGEDTAAPPLTPLASTHRELEQMEIPVTLSVG